ncbi:T185B-like protein [Mya arenaria]|uniref:T185B-like protein n=1 Tax=Mya arenaria TaxID=6604 RepID=A0ABY7EWG6_MYAAR|nr:T185B-like protein [Mya arenaria]
MVNLQNLFQDFNPRLEGDSFVQYKAMVITTSLHLMLLVFDILACDNLQTEAHSWMFVFIPLMFMSIVAIGFCLELFCSVNILQFIFLALRLDNIVFIPIWIVMCISMIGVIYAIILAILLSRSPEIIRDQRRGNLTMAIGYSLLVIPMLIFEEYGNISYTSPQSSSDSVNTPEDSATPTKQKLKKVPIEDQQKVVMPIVSIDMPD